MEVGVDPHQKTEEDRGDFRPSAHTPLQICRVQNLDIPQSSRGGAAHGGAAGRGGAGQDGTPTGRFAQETTDSLPPKASRTNVLNVISEARRNEILCKPIEEHNERLTRG